MLRLLWVVALALIAFAAGVAAVFVHATDVRVAETHVPAGLALALAGLASLLAIAQLTLRSRPAKLVVGVCWLAPVVLGAQTRTSGDLLVTAGLTGMALLFGAVVMIGVVVGLPAPTRSRNSDEDVSLR